MIDLDELERLAYAVRFARAASHERRKGPEAKLIAAARTALPELIAEVRLLRTRVALAEEGRNILHGWLAERMNERAAIVAWLRELDANKSWGYSRAVEGMLNIVANRIERGEHST